MFVMIKSIKLREEDGRGSRAGATCMWRISYFCSASLVSIDKVLVVSIDNDN